MFLKGYKLSDL